jgi:hypothetical protein
MRPGITKGTASLAGESFTNELRLRVESFVLTLFAKATLVP